VIAWDIPDKVRLAGVVVDKPNHMATIHLTKGAPKSTRLDEVSIRKRAATKGDVVVEVKPGEEVVSVNVGWTVEKFVEEVKEPSRKAQGMSGKRKDVNGKKPAKATASAKASPNGRVKKASPKGKATKAKPVKKSPTKAKKKK
jgi:hypothetical protein